jgi:hypothetical protein
MLNFTPATATAATAHSACAYAASAAMRPLAGFGAGAFACEGTWASPVFASPVFASPVFATPLINETAALALPRVKRGVEAASTAAIGNGHGQAGQAGAAYKTGATYKTSVVDIVRVDSVQQDTHNFIQTARQYPVTPGGVGPHPAREPEPV